MEKYSISMRVIHWLMVVLMFTLLAVGLWMVDLPQDYPGKFDTIYPMHKSFGMIALILIFIRIVERLRHNIPSLPKEISNRDKIISAITMLLLYVCMLAQPISGYLMSTLGGHEVLFFNLKVPSLFAENKPLAMICKQAHTYIAYLLIISIVLHLAGSIKHYVVEKVNLLPRMW